MFILIVDNNQFYATVLKEMLLGAGFINIECVESGLECLLHIYKGNIPDVIIIDENQCQANGVDVLKNIRNSCPDHTVIILTSEKSPVNFNLIPKVGSVLYFAKENITADNLPQALYTIFTEKVSFTKKSTIPKVFTLYKKSLAGILN